MAGFGLYLKLVLYLESKFLTESLSFLNPQLRQAAKRYNSIIQNRQLSRIYISITARKRFI
jgi:hypothetical protein